MEKFWGENVRSTPTSITSGWIESTQSYVILGGGVAVCVCLLLSEHRAVMFAIAQLSCFWNTVYGGCEKTGSRTGLCNDVKIHVVNLLPVILSWHNCTGRPVRCVAVRPYHTVTVTLHKLTITEPSGVATGGSGDTKNRGTRPPKGPMQRQGKKATGIIILLQYFPDALRF